MDFRVALTLTLTVAGLAAQADDLQLSPDHAAVVPTQQSASVSLRERFTSRFLIGVAVDGELPQAYNTAELQLIRSQFSAITPANCMKMYAIQPVEGEFHFRRADDVITFASRNAQNVCGHTLVWAKDERTPGWFFKDGNKPASRELLLQRMKTHIEAVAKRYRGKVVSWDVINEVLADDNDYLRRSKWLEIAGEEFIPKAFEYARAADPGAMLILNDYNIEWPSKRPKLLRLLQWLRERKSPIDGVGLQGHFELDTINFQDVEDTIKAIERFGLKVAITELDIDVVTRSKWWAEDGRYRDELSKYDPYAQGCPPEILKRQAEQFKQLFGIFERHADCIVRISFWDLHDGKSWLNTFPWNRTNHPTFFDRQSKPKPAFDAVVGSRESRSGG